MRDDLSRNAQDILARRRFAALSAIRFGGALLVIFGMLTYAKRLDFIPDQGTTLIGLLAIAAGLIATFWIPLALARQWRTPDA